jgi:hypothetical protein
MPVIYDGVIGASEWRAIRGLCYLPNSVRDTIKAMIKEKVDKLGFRQGLGLGAEENFYKVLIDPNGMVLWQDQVAFVQEKADSLVAAIENRGRRKDAR